MEMVRYDGVTDRVIKQRANLSEIYMIAEADRVMFPVVHMTVEEDRLVFPAATLRTSISFTLEDLLALEKALAIMRGVPEVVAIAGPIRGRRIIL